MTEAAPSTVTLTLDRAVAVVLLDILGRVDEPGAESTLQPLDHASERAALWVLRSALEGAVGEDVVADYEAAVDAAHTAVVADLAAK